jgi:hypothetical protein
MKSQLAILGAIAVVFGAAVTPVESAEQPRAVIELFTSQGCSSCPPADKLVGELSKDPSLIALSLAIDYWDYLGWKDTLALPGHSRRQRAYSRVRGDRNVYTPQAIVNGAVQALGSDKSDIEKAIALSRGLPATLSIPVTMTVADGKLTVSAPAGKAGNERGEVWLCPVSRELPVAIGRGENEGHTITYHNVVRRWIKIGEWLGVPATWTIPLKDFQTAGVDEVAVIVQSGTAAAPGPMYAAALTQLR